MTTIVVGTHNKKKAREIARILESSDLRLLTLDDFPNAPEPIEDGKTFAENAIKKATELADELGQLVVADDSGLEVDALDGRPGVFSARYGGEHGNDPKNIERVLRELECVPPEKRTARFKCVASLASPGKLLATTEGVVEGVIADAPSGTNGFGYDPVFIVPVFGRTCAELDSHEKDSISHRGQAFRAMKFKLNEMFPQNQ